MRAAALAVLLVPAIAAAEPLTLDDVLANLERTFPSLQAARQEVAAAEAEVKAAQGAFDTTARVRGANVPYGNYPGGRVDAVLEQPTTLWGSTFFAGYRLGLGQFPDYYGMYETGRLGEVRAGINVPLWRNGPVDRRRTAIARAELQTRAARAGTDLQLIDSVRQATQRYWDWVAAGQRLRVAEELLRIARERQEGIEERARAGDIPEIEGADNARTIRQREARVVAAERTLQAAAIELSLYLRDPDGTPRVPDASRLPDAFPAPMPSSELERLAEHTELAFARRPELVRLQAQRGQQELEREWAANQAAPAVDLSIAASRDLGEVPPKLQKTDLELGLLIELPLQRRTAIGRREAAEATIAGLQAQLRLTMDRIQNEVRDAAIGLDAARRRVELAAAEITLAERLAEGERTRLSLGDSNVLLVNLREQALAEARLGLVEALQEYFRTRAQFGYATGAWLPAGDSPQG